MKNLSVSLVDSEMRKGGEEDMHKGDSSTSNKVYLVYDVG